MNCCLALANSAGSNAGVRSSAASKPSTSGRSFFRHFAWISSALHADVEGDLGADLSSGLRDGELVLGARAAIQQHARQRRHRRIVRAGHRIARRQRSRDDDHVLDVGAVRDQVDARGV